MATKRGTSNGNERGSSYDRKTRRAWVLANFAADQVKVVAENGKWTHEFVDDHDTIDELQASGYSFVPLVRCFRCGLLLEESTMTIDRIEPGAMGGRYTRDNIRPCCSDCNESTGGKLGNERKRNK